MLDWDSCGKMAACRRVLITGASGLLGRALIKEFSDSPNWQVLGLAHSRVSGSLKKVDLLNFDETKQVVEDFKPHLLIHSAAERRPDVVSKNPQHTQNLNVGTTEFLANLVESFNKGLEKPCHFMLYISTDYIFDGTKPPYKPEDPPHPLNEYGRSKLEGEQALMRCHESGLILRVPVLYGNVEYLGESAVTVLLTSVQDTATKRSVDDYQLRYPTLVDDVAKVVLFMADRKRSFDTFSGIFHWSNDEQMTKYMMASKMAELFGLPIDHLSPNANAPTDPIVTRPYNTQLHCGKLEGLMGDDVVNYRTRFADGIVKYLDKFVK